MNDLALKQKLPRGYSKHGLTTLKRGVNALSSRAIDKRTTLGKSLAKWRGDLIADLGGDDKISTQQSAPDISRWFSTLSRTARLERRHKTKTLDDILNEDDSVNGSNGAGQSNGKA